MAIEYVCDHCGKRELARPGKAERGKPSSSWLERAEGEKVQAACSEACALEIAKGMGIEIPIVVKA